MMKRRYHVSLLLVPVLLLFILWVYFHVGKMRTAQYVVDADGLRWTVNDSVLKAEVEQHVVDVGFIEYSITISQSTAGDSVGSERFSEVVGISSDLGGGGFVKGMQVDSDPELELVYVLHGTPEESYFVDISAGGSKAVDVVKKTLTKASKQALRRIDDWLSFNVVNPFAIGTLLVLCLAYYLLYFPLFWIARATARRFRGHYSTT